MRKLTERQRTVLSVLEDVIQREGRAPTVRELCKLVGLASTNGMQDHLKALEKKGYIRGNGTRARSIELLVSLEPVSVALVAHTEDGQCYEATASGHSVGSILREAEAVLSPLAAESGDRIVRWEVTVLEPPAAPTSVRLQVVPSAGGPGHE